MPKLRIQPSARDDLVHILKSVGRESGSASVGEHVVRGLRTRCAELARLPGTMGRVRTEIAPGLRSSVEGSFVIFFRYTPSHLEVIAIVDGRRDIAVVEERVQPAVKQ